MSAPVKAYPLAWPVGWKRTEPARRRRAQFGKSVYQPSSTPGGTGWNRKSDLTISDSVQRVLQQLRQFGVQDGDAIISTNIPVRLDGLPRGDARMPADPGAAVYWTRIGDAGGTKCMAIDQYDRVEHNLAAIAATLDAMRAIERHGGALILERAFSGFTALPAPITGGRPWRDVLGFPEDSKPSPDDVERSYRTLRSSAHPDRGGSADVFRAVQGAYEQAVKELGA